MRPGNIQGQVNEAGYRDYARTVSAFLRDIDPRPLADLRDDVYQVY